MKLKFVLPLFVAICLSLNNFDANSQNTGFQYKNLGQYNAIGVPDYLELPNEIIDINFQNDINGSLPEGRNVANANPSFIANNNDSDLNILSESDVWVSFVQEGTMNKNTLGFYTYPTTYPPRTIAEIKNRTIIFPNASSENSGGGLKQGNKVYLGRFNANTSIGWFVISNAFVNGKVTQGRTIFYSEAAFNPESDGRLKSHTVLLKDNNRGKLILGFEDVIRNQFSDHDFNDLVFLITIDPYESLNTQNIPNLATSVTTKPQEPPVVTAPQPLVNSEVCLRDGFPVENFNKLKSTIKAQTVESNKPIVIKQAVKTKKVTVAQVKQIIKLILIEQYKLDMAKYLFDYTCDKSNYYEINALLNAGRVRELEAFLKDKDLSDDNQVVPPNSTTPVVPQQNQVVNSNCDNGRMPEDDYEDIKESINAKSFSSDKINVLKLAMNDRCISSNQVKEMVELFSFDADKLTVAKFLYKFTSDKQNYYKVNDAFSFSSSSAELTNYIKSVK